jgi:hypothetical protein
MVLPARPIAPTIKRQPFDDCAVLYVDRELGGTFSHAFCPLVKPGGANVGEYSLSLSLATNGSLKWIERKSKVRAELHRELAFGRVGYRGFGAYLDRLAGRLEHRHIISKHSSGAAAPDFGKKGPNEGAVCLNYVVV